LYKSNCFLEGVVFIASGAAILLNRRDLILLIFENIMIFVIMQIIRIALFHVLSVAQVVGVVDV
jgi:hypothetical protein